MNASIQVLGCTFREDGYYALRLRDGVTDIRRCEWNGILGGIDIYDAADERLEVTLMDPGWFDHLYVGRVEAVPLVLEGGVE